MRPPPPSSFPSDGKTRLEPLQFLTLLKRAFAYVQRYPGLRNRLFVAVILRALQLMGLMWLFSAVINGPIAKGSIPGTVVGTAAFALLMLWTQVTFGFRIYWALELGESVVRDLRADLFAHLQTLTARFFQKMEPGRIISRMLDDVDSLRVGVQDVCFVTVVQLLQMLSTGVILLWTDWVLFLVLAAMGPLLWKLNRLYQARISGQQRQVAESFSRITAVVAEGVDGVRVTQGFVRQEKNAGIFRNMISDHSRKFMKTSRTNAIFLPSMELSGYLFRILVVAAGAYRVLYQGVPLATVVQFFFMAGLFLEPIRILGTQYNQALTSMIGAERVFEMLDEKPDWVDAPTAKPVGHLTGRVEFRKVSFGYNPETLVLKDIDFVVEPGQTVALVGHTGSGKSSIVNLLTKSYLPTSGEIFFDGHEIREISSFSLRRQLGIVQQKNYLFSGTLMENIRFSRPEATDAEILAVTRRLGLDEIIRDLPQGYETEIVEGGENLSLGQRQVVCFARALLSDPRILILDEATSSIDHVTEHRLQAALDVLMEGRTAFVVAHRLSTIRKADLILVLDQGRIVERGSHEALIRRGGIYRGLYEKFVENTLGQKGLAEA